MKKILIYYFFLLFFLLTIFSSGIFDSQDGLQYLAVARNIYYKGKPSAPPYEYDTRKNVHMSIYTGKDGDTYSLTGLGYSLAYVPAVFVTDMVYKIYRIIPPIHFPLENDWLILLTASFTNAFFGAILGVTLFIYFILLGLSRKQATFMSLAAIFTTNLFVYTKHSFVHMMFASLLMLCFLMIKTYSLRKKKYLIFLSGIFYGMLSITYNQTFILPLLPLILYYILLIKPKININGLKMIARDVLYATIGFLPFILIYFWFEGLRAGLGESFISSSVNSGKALTILAHPPVTVFLEGLFGQLVSPGRSFFIYSPLFFIPIIFWNKIRKQVTPELVASLVLFGIYVLFYSTIYTVGKPGQGIAGHWHGESSWGPRYLTPLIPMGMLVIGHIYSQLKRRQILFIFLPLLFVGFYIEILGVLVPYQTKFYNLVKFYVNDTEYTPGVYSNLLPRYSPVLKMTKNLIKIAQNFPKTYDHGIYNVKYYDGIELPFNVGPERWREVEGKGYISFDNNEKNTIKEVAFGLINHPITESSESAKMQFILNDKPLLDAPLVLTIRERELVKVPIKSNLIKPTNNKLVIEVNYDKSEIVSMHKQILGFLSFDINGQRQNLESLDIPYVSPLGPKMMGITYQNWGGTNKDPWRLWSLHTQIFERVPDLWWLRNLYHWDIPKKWILIPFAINLLLLTFTGFKLKRSLLNEE